MHKNNLCRLPSKVLVCEESDTISQSSFNSKKCLFSQPKKEPKKQQNTNRYFNHISKAIMAFQPTKKNITNNIVNIKTNKDNKAVIKKKTLSFLNILKKNTVLKYEKSIEDNANIFYIGCLVNKYKICYRKIDYEYLKQYYIYSDSVKIIPKKAFYYRHHMLFLELPNFKNTYLNNLKRNNGLDKLNIYRNLNYPDKLLKINQQENLDSNNSKESGNKVFDTNVIETLENYSTTMTQESNMEKVNSLTPLEIFRRCCDTNKNKKTCSKLKDHNQNNINRYTKVENKKNKEEKSLITFSESEISYISKNINDDSIISIVRNLTKKRTTKYKYSREKEQQDFRKHYGIKKGISTSKDKLKKVIVYTMKPENEKVIQFKKYANMCGKKVDSNVKPKNIKKKLTKIKNNNANNITKNTKRGVSTSTNNKRQKIIFDFSHQNTYSNNESKKTSFVNNVKQYTFIEDKKSFGPSFTSKKNKGVLNLKKESCLISIKDNNNINFISSSYKGSNSNNNFQDFYSVFLTPKNDCYYRPDTYQKKYLDKQKKNSFIVSKNSILFNNTNNTNILEASQNKSKNVDYSHSKTPLSIGHRENRVSQKKVIKKNAHKRHMILTDLDLNKLTLSNKKVNEQKTNNFKTLNAIKIQIGQLDRRNSLNANQQYKKNCKINFIK